MPNIANISRSTVVFRDKKGRAVSIAPGEAQKVDIDRDDVRIVSAERAKLIEVGGSKPEAEKKAREKAPAVVETA